MESNIGLSSNDCNALLQTNKPVFPFVYIKDETRGWMPAKLQQRNPDNSATVICESGESRTVQLKDYGAASNLPLQCVGEDGVLQPVDDLRDLPYLHEASVLYNLKERYEKNDIIYTRAHDRVLIAINPYRWIEHLYADEKRILYAEHFVWKQKLTEMTLPPHIYEVSSLAMKGIHTDDDDQTIIVSGESGSGKTVASKIIMSHLATFHELKKAYIAQIPEEDDGAVENSPTDYENSDSSYLGMVIAKMNQRRMMCLARIRLWVVSHEDNTNTEGEVFDIEAPTEVVYEEPEEMKQTNLIVQRVLDANPLLEAFGNAKTQFNDNSSRFSRHCKLQFHVQNLGPAHQACNIAGSVCDTFLLEKSRVVSHDEDAKERTFHIFYQLMGASEVDKQKIWNGLVGKDASSFKNIGANPDVDTFTNEAAWKNTIAALHTIDIHGKALESMLQALCIVMQLGNITFETDPDDSEGSIVGNPGELEALSPLIGISSSDLAQCLTFKTVTAVHDTYKVPLSKASAKATCDAFAKEIYSVLFDWLVQRTNEATCATKNYMFASEETKYRHIAALDLFGFECHDKNNFEQLLINHANERLQKNFTENFIYAVIREYDSEGVKVDDIEHESNDAILKLLEGKMGFMALLNEECIRPQGNDAGFVNKIYAIHKAKSSGSALVKKKHYDLSPTQTLFGISHFAGTVDYDAEGFVEKNRDTLAEDVLQAASNSSNDIVVNVSQSYQRIAKRKGSLVGTSLWTKFGKQMKDLFVQIEKTRITYVRCIIPNTRKELKHVDPICTINQLRSVGLLSAIKMSHTYPDKQNFSEILQRFWPLVLEREELRNLRQKYRFGRIPKGSNDEMKQDCEMILSTLHADTRGVDKPFVAGRSKVYFRCGGLEQLELELASALNHCATTIQRSARGYLTRARLKAPREENDTTTHSEIKMFFIQFLALPRNLCKRMVEIFQRRPMIMN